MAGHIVLEALRKGWRPVADGSLPAVVPSSSSSSSSASTSFILVAHVSNRKVHVKHPAKDKSICGMWTCGSLDCPSKITQFSQIPLNWERCRPCAADTLGVA